MPQARGALARVGVGGLGMEVLVVDADGERGHAHVAPRQAHRRRVVHDGDVKKLPDVREEVPDVGLGLEREQVRPEQPGQQLLAPAQDAEDRRRRKGNVPEDPDPDRHAGTAQEPRHQAQMEIVDPDEIVSRDARGHGGGEALVGRTIGHPVVLLDATATGEHVAERPQHLIREAGVVVADLALLQAHGADRIGEAGGLGGQLVGHVLPDPGDPRAAVEAERIVERAGEAADRPQGAHALWTAHHLDRCTIGHYDQTRRTGHA